MILTMTHIKGQSMRTGHTVHTVQENEHSQHKAIDLTTSRLLRQNIPMNLKTLVNNDHVRVLRWTLRRSRT